MMKIRETANSTISLWDVSTQASFTTGMMSQKCAEFFLFHRRAE
jgi:hypothetical protein